MLLGTSIDGAMHAHCALMVGPENKATALLISHCQRSDICRKPGTAFAMEYQTPGTDVRTLVPKSTVNKACSILHSSGLVEGLNNEPWH
eukprot:2102238-Amphidinium_carterae.1